MIHSTYETDAVLSKNQMSLCVRVDEYLNARYGVTPTVSNF
jgi:hypothetical protein